MEGRFLYRQASAEEGFRRILFYSVLLHYIVFFLIFGNPFLILNPPIEGPSRRKGFDVELLSSTEVDRPGAPRPEPEREGDSRKEKREVHVFPPGERTEETDLSRIFDAPDWESRPDVREKGSELFPPPEERIEDGINVVSAVETKPEPQPMQVRKKTTRTLPLNLTGPEDCLLKVVAMVCPNA
ncbi:MAG: hypothetical protein ACE5HN_02695, partial [Nitrospiria bacterium]